MQLQASMGIAAIVVMHLRSVNMRGTNASIPQQLFVQPHTGVRFAQTEEFVALIYLVEKFTKDVIGMFDVADFW